MFMYVAVLPFLFLITSLIFRSFYKKHAIRMPNTEKRILAKSCMSLYTPVAKILFSYYLT